VRVSTSDRPNRFECVSLGGPRIVNYCCVCACYQIHLFRTVVLLAGGAAESRYRFCMLRCDK